MSTDVQSAQFALNRAEVPRNAILSPLRYPGGKLWLADYIGQTLDENTLRPTLFVEPFAGGASIALTLLAEGKVDQIGLMDLDPLVAAFWATVFYDTEWLIAQIETVKVDLVRWHQFRAGPLRGQRQKALACLFLNRTSYSGILARRAGPIGGQRQESSYKIDCRFPRETLAARVQQVGQLRDSVAFIWNCSWQTGIKRLRRMQRHGQLESTEKDTFYYLDPPFFEKADRLYKHYFQDQDHKMLREKLLQLHAPWILSYDAAEAVETLYGRDREDNGLQIQYIHVEYTAARSGAARTAKKEAVITRKEIKLPQGVDVQKTRAKTATFVQGGLPGLNADSASSVEQTTRVVDGAQLRLAREEGAAR